MTFFLKEKRNLRKITLLFPAKLTRNCQGAKTDKKQSMSLSDFFILILSFTEDRKSCGFGKTCRRVTDDKIFIPEQNVHRKQHYLKK